MIGYKPVRSNDNDGLYKALYRGDTNASLSVNYRKNIFFDHGLSRGGDAADLYCIINNCDISEALKFFLNGGYKTENIQSVSTKEEPKIKIKHARNITRKDATFYYLRDRGIDADLFTGILWHVVYECHGREYFCVGWQGNEDGWHLRNKTIKMCTHQGISRIQGTGKNDKAIIVEGMLDWASLKVLHPKINEYDIIVLNGISNTNKVQFDGYSELFLNLDNDNPGSLATKELIELAAKSNITKVKDCRGWYAGSNDINEFLQKKLGLWKQ